MNKSRETITEENKSTEHKKILSELVSQLQKNMISKMDLVPGISHPTDRGDNSEHSWIEWFSTYLPKRYKAAKAKVFDSKGNTSDQIDIVLYLLGK